MGKWKEKAIQLAYECEALRGGYQQYVDKTNRRFDELGELHKKDLERLQQSSSVSLNSMAQQLYAANSRVQHLEQNAATRLDVLSEHTAARRLLREALGYKDGSRPGVGYALPGMEFEEISEPGLVGLVEEVIALAQRVPGGDGEISAAIGLCDALSRTRVREDIDLADAFRYGWSAMLQGKVMPSQIEAQHKEAARDAKRDAKRDALRASGITSVAAAVERAVAEALPSPVEAVYLRDIYKLIHDADVGHLGDSAEVKALLEAQDFVWWPWAPEGAGRRYLKRNCLTPGDWARIVVWFLDAHSYEDGWRTLVDASDACECFFETYGYEKYAPCPVWDRAMNDQRTYQHVHSPCTWARLKP